MNRGKFILTSFPSTDAKTYRSGVTNVPMEGEMHSKSTTPADIDYKLAFAVEITADPPITYPTTEGVTEAVTQSQTVAVTQGQTVGATQGQDEGLPESQTKGQFESTTDGLIEDVATEENKDGSQGQIEGQTEGPTGIEDGNATNAANKTTDSQPGM